MYKLIVLSSILLVNLFSTSTKADDCDISGIWNHSSKPAKLFINLDTGEISVYAHEHNSKSVGLVVLKSVTQDSTKNIWTAQMYNAAVDSFVNVKIASKSCNRLTVNFEGEEVLGLIR